ncbi:hypothetical protein WNY61_09330 [Sulfitobacter sp. AS92]|uniref:hypothetical protein n=1 Tax=Sulfitobacter sp. AS92 TaxID=3135783 RepID=UPI0031756814
MRTIYEIDADRIATGKSRQIGQKDGRPPHWVVSAKPPPEGLAQWQGDGWLVLSERPAPPPPPVPDVVSMRQARLALSRAGLLANAEAAIAGMTGEAGDEARIEWEYATELRRDHPLVAALGQTLGLDDAAKDDLFRQAAQIL